MKESGRAERQLWLLVAPIVVWGLHFLATYVTAAVYCARTATPGTLSPVRWAVLALTAAALAALGLVARRARAVRQRAAARSGETDFLGATALLLCTLSAVAAVAVAAVAFFFGDCRQ